MIVCVGDLWVWLGLCVDMLLRVCKLFVGLCVEMWGCLGVWLRVFGYVRDFVFVCVFVCL